MREIITAAKLIHDLEKRGLYKQADSLADIMMRMAQNTTTDKFISFFTRKNPPAALNLDPSRKIIDENKIYKLLRKQDSNLTISDARQSAQQIAKYNKLFNFLKITGRLVPAGLTLLNTIPGFLEMANKFNQQGPSYFKEAMQDPEQRANLALILSEVASFIPVVGPFARIFNLGLGAGMIAIDSYVNWAEKTGESQKIIDMNAVNALNSLTDQQKARLEQAKKELDQNPKLKLSDLINKYGPKPSDFEGADYYKNKNNLIQEHAFNTLLSDHKETLNLAVNQPIPDQQAQPQAFLDPTKFETDEQKAIRELQELRGNLVPTNFRNEIENTKKQDQNYQYIINNTLGPMVQNLISQGMNENQIINTIRQNLGNDIRNNIISTQQAGYILYEAQKNIENIARSNMSIEDRILEEAKKIGKTDIQQLTKNQIPSIITNLPVNMQSDAANYLYTNLTR
jgi:hypothetical protein